LLLLVLFWLFATFSLHTDSLVVNRSGALAHFRLGGALSGGAANANGPLAGVERGGGGSIAASTASEGPDGEYDVIRGGASDLTVAAVTTPRGVADTRVSIDNGGRVEQTNSDLYMVGSSATSSALVSASHPWLFATFTLFAASPATRAPVLLGERFVARRVWFGSAGHNRSPAPAL
jgi:hypothetical protein